MLVTAKLKISDLLMLRTEVPLETQREAAWSYPPTTAGILKTRDQPEGLP